MERLSKLGLMIVGLFSITLPLSGEAYQRAMYDYQRSFATESYYQAIPHNSVQVSVTPEGRVRNVFYHRHLRYHREYPYYYGPYYEAQNRRYNPPR